MSNFKTKRKELQSRFEALPGIAKVYFQPPENLKLKYPCIVYNVNNAMVNHADDYPYILHRRYEVTYITTDPESSIPDILLKEFQYCSYDRRFVSDNMYHDVFTIYY